MEAIHRNIRGLRARTVNDRDALAHEALKQLIERRLGFGIDDFRLGRRIGTFADFLGERHGAGCDDPEGWRSVAKRHPATATGDRRVIEHERHAARFGCTQRQTATSAVSRQSVTVSGRLHRGDLGVAQLGFPSSFACYITHGSVTVPRRLVGIPSLSLSQCKYDFTHYHNDLNDFPSD